MGRIASFSSGTRGRARHASVYYIGPAAGIHVSRSDKNVSRLKSASMAALGLSADIPGFGETDSHASLASLGAENERAAGRSHAGSLMSAMSAETWHGACT